MLEVCVVGFGALGTLYSFVIERLGKARITAVCRSNYDVVNGAGIDIISEKHGTFDKYKPARVMCSVEAAADREYDYVVCAAKHVPDVLTTVDILGPLLTHSSTFVLLQNGIGIHDQLRQALPDAIIISVCAWTDATAVEGGTVVKHGRLDRLVCGFHSTGAPVRDDIRCLSQQKLETFVDLLASGGSDAAATDDIDSMRWQKNLWNLGYSVFCTISRSDVAAILTCQYAPVSLPVISGFMEEAVRIGLGLGLEIPDTAIRYSLDVGITQFDEAYANAADPPFIPAHYKPSMLVDFEAGRPMEIEGIIGAVVKRARQVGIDCPRLQTAYATLLLLQEPLIQIAKNKAKRN